MYELRYLVFIRKRGLLGLTYKVPIIRTAHVDKPALERIRRKFTFEDMMRPTNIT